MGEASRMAIYDSGKDNLVKRLDDFSNVMRNLYKDRLIFLVTAVYEFQPAIYDGAHLYNRLRITDEIVNIGNSSYQHQNIATSEKTGELLHKSLVHLVLVDKETRRPTPLPQYFREVLQDRAKSVPAEKIQLLTKPNKIHSTSYRIVYSDIDYYGHTNQAAYIRISIDGIVEIGLRGVLSNLNGDIARYWIKTVKCYNLKETSAEDEVNIHIWQNADNPYILYAALEKQGSPVFQCTVEFTEPIPSAKL